MSKDIKNIRNFKYKGQKYILAETIEKYKNLLWSI